MTTPKIPFDSLNNTFFKYNSMRIVLDNPEINLELRKHITDRIVPVERKIHKFVDKFGLETISFAISTHYKL